MHNQYTTSRLPSCNFTHPFRYFTLGTSKSQGLDINPSIYCLENSTRTTSICRLEHGLDTRCFECCIVGTCRTSLENGHRTCHTSPAIGYVFPGFAQHYQDYQPSADHFSNMNTALQLMLIQPLDDVMEQSRFLLFPSWPCSWDVDFASCTTKRHRIHVS